MYSIVECILLNRMSFTGAMKMHWISISQTYHQKSPLRDPL